MQIKYLWEDCSIGFICPFCKEELVADSQNGECKCPDCGMIYSLSIKLCIKQQSDDGLDDAIIDSLP